MGGVSFLLSAVQAGRSVTSDFSQGARTGFFLLSSFWALALFLGGARFFCTLWSLKPGGMWQLLDRHTVSVNKTLIYWETTRLTLPMIHILGAAILFSSSPIQSQDSIAGIWMLAYAVCLFLGQGIYYSTKPSTWI